MNYVNMLFDIYPYIAGAVFLIGSWLRYDYGQYTWRAGSSQMLDKKNMRLASNYLYWYYRHFCGHFSGDVNATLDVSIFFIRKPGLTVMAMVGGGTCGVLVTISGIMLLKRR